MVMALSSIGHGYSGALKVTSIMNLNKPIDAYSWKEYAKCLSSNCEHVMVETLKKEAASAKCYTQPQN